MLARLYDNFLVGCLDMTPQRFLFGLLDDSGDLQGVFSSSTSDSSGVADESGVFLVKRDAAAAVGTRSSCMLLRQREGPVDTKCAQDACDNLRLHRKCHWQCSYAVA